VISKKYFYLGLFVSLLFGGILSFALFHRPSDQAPGAPPADNNTQNPICLPAAVRMRNYQYTKPLLYADRSCESSHFVSIKSAINQQVNSFKASGDIESAAVYLRDFDNGEWMNFNEHAEFHPASLFKVPLMIAMLRMAEKQPGFLDKEFLFDPPKDLHLPVQNYKSKSIEPGKKYTVRELLQYMISYSDNKANWLLKEHLEQSVYDQMFVDCGLGLPLPDQNVELLQVTAHDYSIFMRMLFNSSYLIPEYSDLALSMMAACDFKEGIMQALPPGVKIAHKFGEWDDHKEFELHESGIMYFHDKAYLITIMTKGGCREKLPNVVRSLAKAVLDKLATT
jgi:beta-lactamase class A